MLEQARRCGDRLIVAINSDASVSSLKGPSRPIVGERERARVLAALAAVDAVVIFDEPNPLELIMAMQPDVLVKGGDYDVESIVGAREVQSWGGEVRIVPLVDGFSTTRLIRKAQANRCSWRTSIVNRTIPRGLALPHLGMICAGAHKEGSLIAELLAIQVVCLRPEFAHLASRKRPDCLLAMERKIALI